jgi:hypothetical protein
MVVFYGDESGTHGKGDYVISGYIAHKTTWKAFADMWNAALHAPTPRPINYLKMSEWQHRDGQFTGWEDDEAIEKTHRVLSVLAAFLSSGHIGEFTSSISWEMYNKCVNGRCKEVFSNPYYFNLMRIVMRAAQFSKIKDPAFDGKIHFVFDEGNSAEPNAPKHFQYIKTFAENGLGDCMGTISFASDRDEPALQAADVMAWHTRRNLANIDPPDDFRRVHFQILQDASKSYSREKIIEEGLVSLNDRVNTLIENLEKDGRGEAMSKDQKGHTEYEAFNAAMEKILKANPSFVKAAMEDDKKEREKQRKAKRERKP